MHKLFLDCDLTFRLCISERGLKNIEIHGGKECLGVLVHGTVAFGYSDTKYLFINLWQWRRILICKMINSL